jgi:hypothetical protein
MTDEHADVVEPWMAGDHPGRPFDTGTWLDDCVECLIALEMEAAARPRTVVCLRTNCDRVLVTASYLAETLASGRTLESLCFVADDWVRDIFVPVNGWLPSGDRWWSLTKWEQEQRPFAFLLDQERLSPDG